MNFDVEQMYPCIPQAKPMPRPLRKQWGGKCLLSPFSFNTEPFQKLGWVAETFLISPPKLFPLKEGMKKQAERELHSRVHSSAFPNDFWIQTLCQVPYVTLNLGIFALSPSDKARKSYLMCCIKVFNWHNMQIRKCIYFLIYCNSRK